MEELRTNLRLRHLEYVEMAYDGNCMFAALEQQFEMIGKPMPSSDIRKAVVEEMEKVQFRLVFQLC